ncbi:PRC-barrel domain-containing protein [Streptomyces sp. SPB074]|uniref:PRC-barrel domain-containing protein n=1 Tax=Streptomyces sp. (strain SPB074) TaxID=465543 RepID=UPI001F1AF3A3|nr:PRC-barrel domain-containing protein [Streptomyces sp. SPB074]
MTRSERLGAPGELDGLDVYDDGGEKIGGVDEVYLDDRTGRPEWVTVRTGLLGLREHFVPLAGAVREGRRLTVPWPKDFVREAPRPGDTEEYIDAAREGALYAYYGLPEDTVPEDPEGEED